MSKMRRLLIVILVLSSCQNRSKIEDKDANVKKSYFVDIRDPETENYFEYLGILNIGTNSFNVFNHFRRVKAAENWHGQSRLIFLSEDDTLTYMLNSNSDFPSSIDSNKLYFPQKQEARKIDSLTDIICLPTGCVNKEDNLSDMFFLRPDSVAKVFRGGYLPSEY